MQFHANNPLFLSQSESEFSLTYAMLTNNRRTSFPEKLKSKIEKSRLLFGFYASLHLAKPRLHAVSFKLSFTEWLQFSFTAPGILHFESFPL